MNSTCPFSAAEYSAAHLRTATIAPFGLNGLLRYRNLEHSIIDNGMGAQLLWLGAQLLWLGAQKHWGGGVQTESTGTQ
jgi:hypothetical protein